MLVGYARVSTLDQCLALQLDALQNAGCVRIYDDKMTGRRKDRPGLMAAIDNMQSGDTLVVWKLSRLGRSLKQLTDTVQVLEEKGISLKSLNKSIDTTTAAGKLVFHVFASVAQFESDNDRENTHAGLAAARLRGRHGGRRPVMNEDKLSSALALCAAFPEMPVKQLCEKLGISLSTYYRYKLYEREPANDGGQATTVLDD